MFHPLDSIHRNFQASEPFTWKDVSLDGDTAPALTLRAGGTISEEKRLENLHDFAAVIYCLERGKKECRGHGMGGRTQN